VYRNYEATHHISTLEPLSRESSTPVLQEYFVTKDHLESFVKDVQEIFTRYNVNLVNISIRHAIKDTDTNLAWARDEVFAFVIYYVQNTDIASRREVAVWTRELTEAVLKYNGTYYLPYQIHHTGKQFSQAYPGAKEYFATKKIHDPDGKFSNSLLEAQESYEINQDLNIYDSTFKTIFENLEWRDKFFLFLQNVFNIAPTKDFFSLIQDIVDTCHTDEEIYREILSKI
jgi:hypothetical protein